MSFIDLDKFYEKRDELNIKGSIVHSEDNSFLFTQNERVCLLYINDDITKSKLFVNDYIKGITNYALSKIRVLIVFGGRNLNSIDGLFSNVNLIKSTSKSSLLNLSNFSCYKIKSAKGAFDGCRVETIVINPNIFAKCRCMDYMFFHCRETRHIYFSNGVDDEDSIVDAVNLKSMIKMFYDCPKLMDININFKTSNKLTDITKMFDHCKTLSLVHYSKEFNINGIDLSQLERLYGVVENNRLIIDDRNIEDPFDYRLSYSFNHEFFKKNIERLVKRYIVSNRVLGRDKLFDNIISGFVKWNDKLNLEFRPFILEFDDMVDQYNWYLDFYNNILFL